MRAGIQFVLGLGVVGAASSGWADVIVSNPGMPPLNSAYVQPGLFQDYPNGIGFRNVFNHGFIQSTPLSAGTQVINYSSAFFEAEVTLDGGASWDPFSSPSNSQARFTFINLIGSTSTYDTEMLAMNFSGGSLPAGVLVRESPTLPSLGTTTITDLGGGSGYQISSFFDVFTELSTDGGQSWIPSGETGRLTVANLPEPTAGLLLGAAFMGMTVRRRKADLPATK